MLAVPRPLSFRPVDLIETNSSRSGTVRHHLRCDARGLIGGHQVLKAGLSKCLEHLAC